jgi:PhnB protein
MSDVKPVPEGMTYVIPHLTVKGAARAIDFYKKAFGATEMSRQVMPDGVIIHASLKIGGGHVFLNEEVKDMGCIGPQALGGTPVYLMMYVPDVDATFKRAIDAGAEEKMAVSDQFWGDRYGIVIDPFGHYWELATHKEDVSPEEMDRRSREMMEQMKQK